VPTEAPSAPEPPAAAKPVEPAPAAPPPAWFDQGHTLLNEGFQWPVERFDRFFADEREVDLPRAGSFVRWRTDMRIRDDGRLDLATDVRAEVHLPELDRRLAHLQLEVSSIATSTADQLLSGEAPPDAVGAPNAGLRLPFLRSLYTQSDVQVGLLFRIPVGWYTRLRLRRLQPLPAAFLARGALSVFWQTNTGFGTRQDASLERLLAPWLLARVSGTGTLSQRSRGWEWLAEAGLISVGERTALALGGAVLGATAARPGPETWRFFVRARRDVLRRWLFLELEPEVEWSRPTAAGWQRLRAVILRMEVRFDAAARADAAAGPE
jgi:hypothetical protein